MKEFNRTFKLCLLPGFALVVLLVSGCTKPAEDFKSQKKTEEDSSFIKLSEEYIKTYLDGNPEYGTSLGLHEYDGKISDYSNASYESKLANLKSYEKKLLEIDTAKLSKRMYYNYRILLNSIRKGIFNNEEVQNYKRNPMTYAGAIDVNIYVQRDFAPIEERVRSIIEMEKKAPDIFAAARENLNELLPGPYIETSIQVAKGSADFLANDLPVALEDVKNEELMSEFKAVNDKAVEELKSYTEYLEKEKLPKATGDYALGRDKYVKMLEYGEMIRLTPEEILEIGMKELGREQKEFEETAKIIDPDKDAVDVYKDIQKDHPTAESLLPDARKNMEAIRQFMIDNNIVTMPSDVRVRIEETPKYNRATSFASMDTPGPYETKATEAYYYITPVDEKWSDKQKEEWLSAFNYYTTDIVSIHEAYPGHYTQFLHLNASPTTKVEKIFGSYAYSEGWAHYTEKMMIDEGFGADKDSITTAKYRLAQLGESLLRLCRLCVSIQMHTQGMTVEDGTKFFMDNCYYEEQPAKSEAIRGTFDPGYLYYTLGKLQILKLREDYKQQEGENFSLKKFHDTMLDNGMPPVRLLREVMLTDKSKYEEIL